MRSYPLPLVVLVLVLVGCAEMAPAPAPSPKPKPPSAPVVNLMGYPPDFRQGHADGCASARGTRKRDESRFKSDESYAQGWRDGYDICSARK